MGTIFNIQRYCLHDGDGIRTAVFLKGCPLRCIWCHNPEGLSDEVSVLYNTERCSLCLRCVEKCACRVFDVTEKRIVLDREKCRKCGECARVCLNSANELMGKSISANEVIREVLKDKIYYNTSGGGMTVSGGEPSMQADFTLSLIKEARSLEISTCIETCGIGSRWFYESAADMGASFLYDLKCMNSAKHKELTGVDNQRIIDNLLYLFSRGADVVIRLPMIPGINDTEEDVALLCEFLRKSLGKYRKAEIMPYHSFGISKAKRLGKEDVFVCKDADEKDKARWKQSFLEKGVNVEIN